MPRVPILAASVALLAIHSAAAQSKRGIWTGTSTTQQGTQPLTIVLDSTASGWKGAAVAPASTSDSLRLVDVSVRADTLEFGIPFNGVTVYLSGQVVGDKFSSQIWMQNTSVGAAELTHKPSAAGKPPATLRLRNDSMPNRLRDGASNDLSRGLFEEHIPIVPSQSL
jgi:hypothetical protein